MSASLERAVFVDAAGVRLRAIVSGQAHGSARPVLLLHGFTGGAESMAGVAGPLARERPVVRLELVGHGESEAPTSVSAYRMEACADQIAAAVAALGLERPHLIAYSMGARAGLVAALTRPELFASLVLIGVAPGLADPVLRAERIASDEALADRIERDGIEAFVDHWMALPIFASQSRLGPEALAAARAERLRNRAHGLANSLRGMGAGAQAPQQDRLTRFEGPVLLVVGEQDARFRQLAASLEARMQDARTCLIADAGHAAHLEAPESFLGATIGFLARAERRDGERVAEPAALGRDREECA